jgi:vacuolar protein sorting-associated protein 45
MSLSEIVRDYIERILQDQKDMKVLVLDDETTSIVSLVISQSTILEREVFLVEKIESSIIPEGSRDVEKLSHMSAIYIVRPTDENVEKIGMALANPKYGSYYIYFTNTVKMEVLRKLANSDRNDLVK